MRICSFYAGDVNVGGVIGGVFGGLILLDVVIVIVAAIPIVKKKVQKFFGI